MHKAILLMILMVIFELKFVSNVLYKKQDKLSINSSYIKSNLIKTYTYIDNKNCLLKCNEEIKCFSCMYNEPDGLCSLFNRTFNSNESQKSNLTTVYVKRIQCEYKIYFL